MPGLLCSICGYDAKTMRGLTRHNSDRHPQPGVTVSADPYINTFNSNFSTLTADVADNQYNDNQYDNNSMDTDNYNDIEFDDSPAISNASDYYLLKQFTLCEEVYGAKAFFSKNRQSFVNSVHETKEQSTAKDYACFLIYKCLYLECCLPRRDAEKVLQLFHVLIDVVQPSRGSPSAYFQELHDTIPRGWRQVSDRFRETSIPKPTSVPYPERWLMDYWDQSNGPKPQEISLIPLDPIEKIAEQWLNPELAFCYEKEIKFAYTPDTVTGGQPCFVFHF
jgi:hypothetical protein